MKYFWKPEARWSSSNFRARSLKHPTTTDISLRREGKKLPSHTDHSQQISLLVREQTGTLGWFSHSNEFDITNRNTVITIPPRHPAKKKNILEETTWNVLPSHSNKRRQHGLKPTRNSSAEFVFSTTNPEHGTGTKERRS